MNIVPIKAFVGAYCSPIFLFIALSSTIIESATVTERPGEPETFNLDSEDPEMNRAIKQARKTIENFLKQLVSPKPNQTHFSVKKPFPVGKVGENEHIWIDDLRYDGKRLHGRISNAPVDLKSLKSGDPVSLLPSEISDWMILEDGHIVGGFTFRILWERMTGEERRRFGKVRFKTSSAPIDALTIRFRPIANSVG